jgi:glycerophosphoryl diester phosphodiesterase
MGVYQNMRSLLLKNTHMKFIVLSFNLLLVGLSLSCKQEKNNKVLAENTVLVEKNINHLISIDSLIANLEDSNNNQVMVVAHRGDWRNAPENSLQAIENCIKMGVDMVEIDVRETKDGVLVLMHDEAIDRTTTGKGNVSELTWEYFPTLDLRDGIGHSTSHKIPTLEEALVITKDKILVNLDKSYEIFDKCFKVAQKTGTVNQVIIKGPKTRNEVEKEFGQYLDKVYFMPIVRLANPDAPRMVEDYLKYSVPVAFEFTVPQDTIAFIEQFDEIREKGSSVWVNSLWPQHNGGHDDERAVLDQTIYDWFINNNIDIIQTDRPQVLLDYLRSKNLHK